MSNLYYTGVGSRATPENTQLLMVDFAKMLAEHEFVLRSGGAQGADSAFEYGCDLVGGEKEIYLPWNGFNGRRVDPDDGIFSDISEAAFKMAEEFHPNWAACSAGARQLHARNCHQVLGRDLQTPSTFVLCWTPNGTGSGGTGQAIRIARSNGIPVFDLGSMNILAELEAFLQTVS